MRWWGESALLNGRTLGYRQSVLDSVNGDQERALDVLLGMSDPEYVSTQPVQQVRLNCQCRPILYL